jgi:glutamine phosphoribosylpyrophosphate amidotransferase
VHDVEYITYNDHDDAVNRQKLNSNKQTPALGTARAMKAAGCARAQRPVTAQQAATHINPTNGSSQGGQLRLVHQGDLENRQQ